MVPKRASALFASLVLALLAGCSSSEKRRNRADLHLNLGTSFLQNGNFRAALKELRTAADLDPKNETVQNNLGLSYFLLEQPKLAEQHLRRAIDLKSDYSDAHNNLARVLVALHNYEEAQKHAQIVLKDLTYPEPQKAWYNLGLSYFAQDNFRSAAGAFQRYVKAEQQNCSGYLYLGRSYMGLKDYEESLRLLDWASKNCTQSDKQEALYYSGLAAYHSGQKEKASARFDELTKKFPNSKLSQQAIALRKNMGAVE